MKKQHFHLTAWTFFCALFLLTASCKENKRPVLDDEDDTELSEDEDDEDENEDYDPINNAPVIERNEYTFYTEVKVDEDDMVQNIILHMDQGNGDEYIVECPNVQPLDTIFWHGFGDIEEQDINFDGWPDVQVCLGPQNSFGNHIYDAWIWDPDDKAFVFVDNYADIPTPELDPKEKVIRGSWRLDNDYDEYVYKWKQGRLVKISSTHTDLSEDFEEE